MPDAFQIKMDPELWSALDMDVERFSNIPPMLTGVYQTIFLGQKNRPEAMAYFDSMIAPADGDLYGSIVQKLQDTATNMPDLEFKEPIIP